MKEHLCEMDQIASGVEPLLVGGVGRERADFLDDLLVSLVPVASLETSVARLSVVFGRRHLELGSERMLAERIR